MAMRQAHVVHVAGCASEGAPAGRPDDGLPVGPIQRRVTRAAAQAAHRLTHAPALARGVSPMALDKPYLDIPGTTVFDMDMSRQGYWLNQFCMSLMKADNRSRFKAGERIYLDEWPMTEAQKAAVLARDLNACIRLGGNIYFLAKIGSTDGISFQQMAGSMTGMSDQEYRDMMINGGRSPQGNRYLGEDGDAQPQHQPQGAASRRVKA